MPEVYVAGTGLTTFGPHGPGTGVALAVDAAMDALQDADIDFSDVDALFTGTAHPLSPRGVYVGRELGLTGLPIHMSTNASATGLTAIHDAAAAIEAERADIVLVIGYDAPETEMATEAVIAGEGHAPPVVSFALWAKERMTQWGTRPEHLAMVTAKNWNYARDNAKAARRSKDLVTVEKVLSSRLIADPLTSMMCTPWGEGAAAVVLVSEAGRRRLRKGSVQLSATVLASDRFGPRQILEGSIVGSPALTRQTVDTALTIAGVTTAQVDIVQIHDAFAIEEILYYELLGFSEPGRTEQLIEQGAFGPGSRKLFGLPEFSTDGGLIARGHPGGATGVAQVIETTRRLTSTDDRVGVCHLLGSGSTCIVQVYTVVDDQA
ncbi:thiolase family protein [Kribbella sp. NPDC058245]|uniref:thiolase family protein n=1 Tax=Kribbella sp. NPDC058245 TaxID=3346399 RepID=UPI0036EFE10E